MSQSNYFARRGAMKWLAGPLGTALTASNYPTVNPSLTIEEAEFDGGRPEIGKFGLGGARYLRKYAQASFGVELFGQSDILGTPEKPWYGGAMLRACGLKESVSSHLFKYEGVPTSNPHFYADDNSNFHLDPLTSLVRNVDNAETYGYNMVGNAIIRFAAGKFPRVDFNMRGQARTNQPTISDLVHQAQTAFTTVPTTYATVGGAAPTTTLAGSTVTFLNFTCDLQNEVDQGDDMSSEYSLAIPRITGSTPKYTGQFEVPYLSTSATHLWNKALLGTSIAVVIGHNVGGTSGEVITFTGNFILDSFAPIGNVNGKLCYAFSGTQNFGSTAPTLTWS